MEKGQLGLRLSFFAVVAFFMAMFGQIVPLVLIVGVAIIVEKNIWLTRQVIQALCLSFFSYIVSYCLGILGIISSLGSYIPVAGASISKGWNIFRIVVDTGVDITVLIFALLAILRVAKGKEAKVPVANKFANWACGIVMMKK